MPAQPAIDAGNDPALTNLTMDVGNVSHPTSQAVVNDSAPDAEDDEAIAKQVYSASLPVFQQLVNNVSALFCDSEISEIDAKRLI